MLRDTFGDNIFSLLIPGETVIGRGKNCDIVIDDPSVSKRHASVNVVLDDTGNISQASINDFSSFGSFVGQTGNMRKIHSNQQKLQFGDYIRFGNMKTMYVFENVIQDEPPRDSQYFLNYSDHSTARQPLELSPEPLLRDDQSHTHRESGNNPHRNDDRESPDNYRSQSPVHRRYPSHESTGRQDAPLMGDRGARRVGPSQLHISPDRGLGRDIDGTGYLPRPALSYESNSRQHTDHRLDAQQDPREFTSGSYAGICRGSPSQSQGFRPPPRNDRASAEGLYSDGRVGNGGDERIPCNFGGHSSPIPGEDMRSEVMRGQGVYERYDHLPYTGGMENVSPLRGEYVSEENFPRGASITARGPRVGAGDREASATWDTNRQTETMYLAQNPPPAHMQTRPQDEQIYRPHAEHDTARGPIWEGSSSDVPAPKLASSVQLYPPRGSDIRANPHALSSSDTARIPGHGPLHSSVDKVRHALRGFGAGALHQSEPPVGPIRAMAGFISSESRDVNHPSSSEPKDAVARSVSPGVQLTRAEREEVEKSRGALAAGVRVANKALGGVMEFRDWKKCAAQILSDACGGEEREGRGAVLRDSEELQSDTNELHDAQIRSLLTAEVIDACRAEKLLDSRSTATGVLQKAQANLHFLLEYDNSEGSILDAESLNRSRLALTVHAGQQKVPVRDVASRSLTGAPATMTPILQGGMFDTGLFNGILANTMSLLGSKVTASGLINAVDTSTLEKYHESLQKSSVEKNDEAGPFLLAQTIESATIPKLQGLFEFNKSMRGSGDSSIEIVLDDAQMEKVNRHIITNVLQDITRMLALLDELKSRATGEVRPNSSFKRLSFELSKPEKSIHGPSVTATPPREGKSSTTRVDRTGGNRTSSSGRSNISLDGLSAEFDKGELRISSGDHSPSRQVNSSNERAEKDGGKVGLSRDLWNKLDSRESVRDRENGGAPSDDENRGPVRQISRGMWDNNEYKEKTTALRMMARLERRFRKKMLQKKFHRWIVFVQASSTAAAMAKQMIPFSSQSNFDQDQSVMSAVSADVTQSEEYLRLQEEREQLTREKAEKESALQNMTEQFDHMLRRNSMLQEQGLQANLEMKQKLRVLKLMTSYSENIRAKVKTFFFHWFGVTKRWHQKIKRNDAKKKQLLRVMRLRINNSLTRRLVNRAFRIWERNCLRYYDAVMNDSQSCKSLRSQQAEVCRLQEQLLAVCTQDKSAANLLAERALNRELSAVNIDLQQRLSDIQSTLLEVAKVPPAERKQLVREVLLDRENEVNKARREVRSLREQLGRLEMALVGHSPPPRTTGESTSSIRATSSRDRVGKRGGVNRKKTAVPGSLDGWGSGSMKSFGSQEHSRDGKYIPSSSVPYGELVRNGSEDEEEEGVYPSSDRKTPSHRPEDIHHVNNPHHLSRSDAMKIVVGELRNLQLSCRELENDKVRLGRQLFEETTRYQEQSMAFRLLQQRLMEKERAYEKLHGELIEKSGDKKEAFKHVVEFVEDRV